MSRVPRLPLIAVAVVLVAAGLPQALAGAAGGLWEVGRSADGKDAQRLCLPDPTVLAQWEHRGARCTRIVISDQGTRARFHYTCVNGGFGDTEMTMITPRTLRVMSVARWASAVAAMR